VECFCGSENGRAFDPSECGNETGFHKMRTIHSLTEKPMASEEQLCYKDLFR